MQGTCQPAKEEQRELDVGTDGVVLRSRGRRRFIPYASIRSVTVGSHGSLAISTANGETKRDFHIALAFRVGLGHELQAKALAARIESARQLFVASATANDLAGRVARRTRDVASRRAELERLHDDRYRGLATPDEDLWNIVDDARSPEDVRAAAAFLLRHDADARARLRVAAEAVASPKLRVALEAVADPDANEGVLDEALGELDGGHEAGAESTS